MPVLDWIGKQAVVKHHRDVPYRLLEPVPELACLPLPPGEGRGEGSGNAECPGNLIVEGDNLLALKALLPRYAGQVKCIYIDPPYNTGNEGWAYNDNVNSPEIRKWLGEVVGKEGEMLDRHDRWLCMMYPRLVLLKQFLSEDGAIFVSIDDNEVASLRNVMDEIFGASNFLASFVWKRRTTPDSRNLTGISGDHEYVIAYKVSERYRVVGQAKDLQKYSNRDSDPRGAWMSDNLTGLANAQERPNLHYSIIHPVTGEVFEPHPSRGWIYGRDRMAQLISEGRILWPAKKGGRPRLKRFMSDMKSDTTGFSTVLTAPGNVEATKELSELLGPKVFAFPKPARLIQQLIAQGTDRDAIVLDSFAGSGTTGHAVLKQNADDGGSRRFILVEMDPKIARDVTAERVQRVAQGYTNTKGEAVAGLGGGFQFCRLSDEPLFTAEGQVRADVTFAQLAEFVWFVETGSGLPRVAPLENGCHPREGGDPVTFHRAATTALDSRLRGNDEQKRANLRGNDEQKHANPRGDGDQKHATASEQKVLGSSPLLGVHERRAVYLLYNGILKDKSAAGGNVLTAAVLDVLPPFDGPRVIYAAACRLGAARLAREGIVFKQTPYALER